jgi:hypothetical protein
MWLVVCVHGGDCAVVQGSRRWCGLCVQAVANLDSVASC